MCKERLASGPCWNFKCPHNLFWVKLKLRANQIHMTKKAMEIGNCCCLINKPWDTEDIEAIWGLPREEIKRCEKTAMKKIYRREGMRMTSRLHFS